MGGRFNPLVSLKRASNVLYVLFVQSSLNCFPPTEPHTAPTVVDERASNHSIIPCDISTFSLYSAYNNSGHSGQVIISSSSGGGGCGWSGSGCAGGEREN